MKFNLNLVSNLSKLNSNLCSATYRDCLYIVSDYVSISVLSDCCSVVVSVPR